MLILFGGLAAGLLVAAWLAPNWGWRTWFLCCAALNGWALAGLVRWRDLPLWRLLD